MLAHFLCRSLFLVLIFGLCFCPRFQRQQTYAQSIDAVSKNLHLTGPHESALRGNLEDVVFDIARSSTSINDLSPTGLTLLDCAIMGKHTRLAKRLVEDYGADVNKVDGRGLSPIHYAAAANATDIIKFLKKRGAHLNKISEEPYMRTAVHEAALLGHVETIKLLVEYRANVNVGDGIHEKPIDLARAVLTCFNLEDPDQRVYALRSAGFSVIANANVDPEHMRKQLKQIIAILERYQHTYKRH